MLILIILTTGADSGHGATAAIALKAKKTLEATPLFSPPQMGIVIINL